MRHPPLIWIDLETTGLDPDTCKILEIAVVATDSDLKQLAEPYTTTIWQAPRDLAKMDEWCTKTHQESGLIDAVTQSTKLEYEISTTIVDYLTAIGCEKGRSPICGNSIAFDRGFLRAHMPTVDAFGHYRSIDVTSISEVICRWAGVTSTSKGKGGHRALPDILASIDQLAECRRLMASGFVTPAPV